MCGTTLGRVYIEKPEMHGLFNGGSDEALPGSAGRVFMGTLSGNDW